MKKIKEIIRKSRITKDQLRIWKKLNREQHNRGICESCFRKFIEMLEEDLK